MVKSFFLSLILIFIFTGCFSLSSINPFEDSVKSSSQENIELPQNAPVWLKTKDKNTIFAIGIAKIKEETLSDFDKKRALIVAGNNLSRKIYSKSYNFLKDYENRLTNPKTFDNDVKRVSEQIALKSLQKSKIKNFWQYENRVFVKIYIDSYFVAKLIQDGSKELYDVNSMLYKNILSNRAKVEIKKFLER